MDQAPLAKWLNRAEIKLIMALEQELITVAGLFDLSLKAAPQTTYVYLAQSAPGPLKKIASHLSDILSVFQICASEKVDPWDDQEFFRISMRRMSLTYPSDFLQNVSEGDLIEGYDLSRFQIFRNLRFMEKSAYSLIEMLSYEWPMLFDRSSAITSKMFNYCDEILWSKNKTISFDIPTHFIRELRSSERQMFEIRFKYLSPLFTGPNQPFGMLGTFKCKSVNAAGLAFV